MRSAQPRRLSSRAATRLLLLLALVAASLTLTHCRMVTDQLTGVSADILHSRPAECLRECQKEFREDMKDEDKRHRVRIHLCRDDANCIAVEEARHAAKVAKLEKRRDDCVNGCHHQGGGGGGH